MQLKFSPSTNIVRDTDKEINYIVTPNSKEVFNNIINNLKSGNKVFNLIGSYGTGKSTFLWALQQNLSQNNEYFVKLNGQFNGIHKFEFIKLIGDSKPLSEALLHTLDFKNENPHEIAIEKLNEFYINKCKKRGKFLFIIIDEFGKFLEYAAKGNLEKELYFIQQLAEYVNDESKNDDSRVIASFASSTPFAVSPLITKPNSLASAIAACIASEPPLSILIIFAPLAPNSL